ncbi:MULTISPECIES: hypothetical protein [Flavobacterium]|uniref:hypothetical protein n=1 Tax=Flavobacterium TaxID=237 RepID=UPI001181E266|nr:MULTISPECIES: hypothetical protein [Flavobacterium]MCR4031520.1 hypothetical protein [Flavobacterium panacis]
METLQKVIELLSKQYSSRISILGNSPDGRFNSILDTKTGAMFSVSNNYFYVFKDPHDNFWSTTPKSFIYNEQRYYPKVGEEYTRKDGIKYSFTTKEAVLEKAAAYFEKFMDQHYGIKVINEKLFFYEGANTTDKFNLTLQQFKARMYDKIDACISFN